MGDLHPGVYSGLSDLAEHGIRSFGHILRHLCSTTFHSRYIPVSRLAGTVGEPLLKTFLFNWMD